MSGNTPLLSHATSISYVRPDNTTASITASVNSNSEISATKDNREEKNAYISNFEKKQPLRQEHLVKEEYLLKNFNEESYEEEEDDEAEDQNHCRESENLLKSSTGRVIKRKKFIDYDEEDLSSSSANKKSKQGVFEQLINSSLTNSIGLPKNKGNKKYKSKKKSLLSTSGKSDKQKNSSRNSHSHQWTTQDDLLLKDAVQNYPSFEKISCSVKFSYRFSPSEIENRWRGLLYNPSIASVAGAQMSEFCNVSKRIMWTKQEEQILLNEGLSDHFAGFLAVLERHRDKFHSMRTAKGLESHFYRIRRSKVLIQEKEEEKSSKTSVNSIPTQLSGEQKEMKVEMPIGDKEAIPMSISAQNSSSSLVFTANANANAGLDKSELHQKQESIRVEDSNFSDIETEDCLHSLTNNSLEKKLSVSERIRMNIRRKEYEKLQNTEGKFILSLEKALELEKQRNSNSMALLRGKKLRYWMTKKSILLGRDSPGNKVDVNLEIETHCSRVSRKQAQIKLKRDGNFYLKNIGKNLMFVNGKPVESNKTRKLLDKCLVEISNVRFIFEINGDTWIKGTSE